ncbi:MAG: OmpA family protein [Chryseolinea sp.]
MSWMNNHPTICIELSGHTDDMGSDEHNLDLSRKRAQAVKSSLISKHISTVRIAATVMERIDLLLIELPKRIDQKAGEWKLNF